MAKVYTEEELNNFSRETLMAVILSMQDQIHQLNTKEIREYIQAMIDSGNEDITPEWIEWALKKADWYDPSIETEDEYLGKRQHEKSAEEKEKSLQDSIRKSWYW